MNNITIVITLKSIELKQIFDLIFEMISNSIKLIEFNLKFEYFFKLIFNILILNELKHIFEIISNCITLTELNRKMIAISHRFLNEFE